MGVSWDVPQRRDDFLESHDVIEVRVGKENCLNRNAMRSHCGDQWRRVIASVDDPSRPRSDIVDPHEPTIGLPCAEGEPFDAKLCHGENITATLSSMLKRRVEEVDPVAVQMVGAAGVSMRLMVGRKDGAPTFAMRHYTVGTGGNTPRHQHNYEHEVIITAGEARVEYDGEFHQCRAGDVLFIEPNRMHQFVNEGSSDLTFVCLVPVSFDCGTPTPGS